MHTKKSYSYSSVCVQYQSQFCVYLPGIRLSALEECFCNSMCEMYRVLENKKYYLVKNNYCFCFIIMIYAIGLYFLILLLNVSAMCVFPTKVHVPLRCTKK